MEYKAGDIVWTDLTVPEASEIKEFYERVVGWKSLPLSMGEYDDYLINNQDGKPIAGVCHARGSNASLPSHWLVYIAVADVSVSIREVEANGGKVIDGPRKMSGKDFCVIQDPAGAVIALINV